MSSLIDMLQPTSWLKPQALRPGATIAIISPAGPTPNQPNELFVQGTDYLQTLGFSTKLMPHAQAKQLYLAGTDEQRLSDLHAAFADPDIDGILCARGGYGSMRLLPNLDFELIRRHPKALIGFSDITALLLPIYQQCGLTGFYGPMLTSNLIHHEPYSQEQLFQLLGGKASFPYSIPNQNVYHCFRPGMVEAPLIGGNLSLLAALCGTPYQPHTAGHILFIEDWKESYYSLDRQIQQLRLAGLFDQIAGLLFCDFSEITPEPEQSLPEFLRDLCSFLDVPVGYGFSVGHGEQTASLPIGCPARFHAETGQLLLLESPVQR